MSIKSFFKYDNKFFLIMGKMVDMFYVSALWLIFSLPIVTMGASTRALYYTVHHNLRRSRRSVWQCFWTTFKENFGRTTKMWMIQLILAVFLILDSWITDAFARQGLEIAGALHFFFYFLILIVAVWMIFTYAYAARFDDGVKVTLKNAGVIAGTNILWAFLALVMLLVSIVMVISVGPFWAFVLPAAVTYVYDIFLERIFRKYMSEEERRLEEERDQEDHIFY